MRRIYFCLAFAFLVCAQAQSPAPILPFPGGPLLNKAPSYSQWLMSVTYEPFDVTKGVKPRKYNLRSLVRKTGPIRDEISISENSGKTEAWFKDGWEAKMVPGATEPQVILPGANTLSDPFEDYSNSDFHGFDWLSKDNYAGLTKVFGTDCIIFHVGPPEDSSTPAPSISRAARPSPSAPVESGTTAFIALDTRLPVLLKAEDATTFYEFQQPPATMLVIPTNIQAALDNVRAAIQRATVMPASP